LDAVLQSERLIYIELAQQEAGFIFELVNSPEWKKFIGERGVNSIEDAETYISKILSSSQLAYWVVKLKNTDKSIGVITLIQRDYLDHRDIGFAFLSAYTQMGYATEAVVYFLNHLARSLQLETILASTLIDNYKSIRLLTKIGFTFSHSLQQNKEQLQIYQANIAKLLLNQLCAEFFSAFTNKNKRAVNLNCLFKLCLPSALFIKLDSNAQEIQSIDTFVDTRNQLLNDGSITEFEEKEISEQSFLEKNFAERISKYEKCGFLNGVYFKQSGQKRFLFENTNLGWRIKTLVWQDNDQ
jgi:RimJ/RimL family protein N-acetyltransferase